MKILRYTIGLILSTDAMVAELPKDEKPAPMPHGGDMDY
jgi:hypothetical protein